MEQTTRSVSLDSAFDALGHRQRRLLLVSLLEQDPQAVSPLLGDPDEDSAVMEQLVMMQHVHVPKLESAGYVEWDRERNEVSRGANFAEIRPLLELVADHEEQFPEQVL